MSFNEELLTEISLKYFDRVGFANVQGASSIDSYEKWLQNGYQGSMKYLEAHLDRKKHPQILLQNAKSWLVFLKYYDSPEPLSIEVRDKLKTDNKGWVARYARGDDYHKRLQSLNDKVISELKFRFPKEHFLGFVDSSPVLERDIAHRAGLGWIGKNSCLIDKDLGSFVFISEILTTMELESSQPVLDHCGTCTRCIDACPTQALLAPKVLDARKCISYWTIEAKADTPPEISEKFFGNLFGCDICQDVCPWNTKARKKFKIQNQIGETANGSVSLNLDTSLQLADLITLLTESDESIKSRLSSTAMSRAKPQRLKKHASLLMKTNNTS